MENSPLTPSLPGARSTVSIISSLHPTHPLKTVVLSVSIAPYSAKPAPCVSPATPLPIFGMNSAQRLPTSPTLPPPLPLPVKHLSNYGINALPLSPTSAKSAAVPTRSSQPTTPKSSSAQFPLFSLATPPMPKPTASGTLLPGASAILTMSPSSNTSTPFPPPYCQAKP